MSDHIHQAISDLEARLRTEIEVANDTKRAINALCRLIGVPDRYQGIGVDAGSQPTQIQPDTFYGKPLMTAMREYLLMRKAAGRGAASVNEIHDALTRGGFKFETKNEENAKAGIRQSLTKNSDTFHKLPTGDYGLLAWYPEAKFERKSPVAKEATAEAAATENDALRSAESVSASDGPERKRLRWALEIDSILALAPVPMRPIDITKAITARHPDYRMPNAGAIVRNTLHTKAEAMGWTRVGEGWIKSARTVSA